MRTPDPDPGPATDRLLTATVTLFDLWRTVLRGVEEESLHPPPEYLEALTQETGGVPAFARWYVDGLESGEITRPRGAPARYLKPSEVESMANLDYLPDMTPRQRSALARLERIHDRLKRYETRDPRIGRAGARFRWLRFPTSQGVQVGLPLRYEKGRGAWKIRRPLEQARRLVGKASKSGDGIGPETVRDWERLDRGHVPGRSVGPGYPLQPDKRRP